MKTIKFIPKVAQGEDAKFSGSVELRVPTFDERFECLEQSGFKMNQAGEVDPTGQISMLRSMVKLSQPFYVSVDLTSKDGGDKFTSFKEMSEDAACDPILIEIAMMIASGFKASKN